jgi:hypothetical protein
MMAACAIEKSGFHPYAKCSRCGAPMTLQKFYSLTEVFWGWRCLLCGEIVDPVILENRQKWGQATMKENGKDRIKRRKMKGQYM